MLDDDASSEEALRPQTPSAIQYDYESEEVYQKEKADSSDPCIARSYLTDQSERSGSTFSLPANRSGWNRRGSEGHGSQMAHCRGFSSKSLTAFELT